MEALATAGITTAFGNGFLSEFIRDTYSFLKDSSKFPQVQETILQLDLKNFMPLAQNLVNFLEAQEMVINQVHIKIAVQQLKSSVQLIRDQLAFIQNTLTTHKNKFLHALRPPSLGKHLHKLTILKINAEKQMNYIVHLLPHHILNQTVNLLPKTGSQSGSSTPNTRDQQYQVIQDLNNVSADHLISHSILHTPQDTSLTRTPLPGRTPSPVIPWHGDEFSNDDNDDNDDDDDDDDDNDDDDNDKEYNDNNHNDQERDQKGDQERDKESDQYEEDEIENEQTRGSEILEDPLGIINRGDLR